MYWNRFDICEAWYCYAVNHHRGQWSKEYAILGRLDRIGFSPGLGVREYGSAALEDNAREIYEHLCRNGI